MASRLTYPNSEGAAAQIRFAKWAIGSIDPKERTADMLTMEQARELSRQWISAWNLHDLNSILAHYSDEIVFSSPFVERLGVGISGSVRGRAALSKYFAAALGKFPSLRFHLRAVLVGVDTVTILYDSVNGLLAAETMALDEAGRITRVWAHYDKL
jgi:ketosteroid isomerase-like protein